MNTISLPESHTGTNNDIDPVVSEHANAELLHHMRISATYVSLVGIEAK
jgi:hypothetical protein